MGNIVAFVYGLWVLLEYSGLYMLGTMVACHFDAFWMV